MAVIKNKQLFGVLVNPFTGSLIVSNSLNVIGTSSANVFSGSGALLTGIPSTAIVGGIGAATQWTLSGSVLFTSQSYTTQTTGSLFVIGDKVSNVFVVKNMNSVQDLFKIVSTGIAQFYVHSNEPTLSADYGQLYFTSSSFYVGLI
jgi:hypothetical protein